MDDKKIKNFFSKYLSEDILENITNSSSDEKIKKLKKEKIIFVLLQLNETNLEKIQFLLSECIRVFIENKFMIGMLFPPFLFATLNSEKNYYKCKKIATSIINNFSSNIKIIYGQVNGAYSNIGYSSYYTYSPIIPNMSKILDQMIQNDFGNSFEFIENKDIKLD